MVPKSICQLKTKDELAEIVKERAKIAKISLPKGLTEAAFFIFGQNQTFGYLAKLTCLAKYQIHSQTHNFFFIPSNVPRYKVSLLHNLFTSVTFGLLNELFRRWFLFSN